jgi:hypothetical protein
MPGAALHLESSAHSELWHDEVVFLGFPISEPFYTEVLTWVNSTLPLRWYNGDLRSLMEGPIQLPKGAKLKRHQTTA